MTSKYKKYSSYKDSGVEWLGEIPEHWDIRRFKTLFNEINERNKDSKGELLSVSQYTGVTKKSNNIEDGDLLSRASSLDDYKKVYKNDLVTNIMLAWNGSLGFSPFDGITSPAYSVYRLKKGNDTRFFHYLVRTEIYKSVFKRNSTGVIESRLRLYTDDFYNISSILPPLQEQTAIANFLDDKTSKIDTTIAQKEQMIALLKERKQIIIQNAVTGKWSMVNGQWSMTPREKMKDSGVEWIGEIPEGWEVKKITHLFNSIGSGTTPTAGDLKYYEGPINFLQTGDLNDGYIYTTKKTIKEKSLIDFTSLKVYPKDSLVMAMYGATIGKLGILKIASATNQACCVMGKSLIVDSIYMFYVFLAFRKEIVSLGYGGGQPNISQDVIKSLRFPIPSRTKQTAIVNFLDAQSTKIDQAITLQQSQIEKLKEYKATLIDGAVTGKIRVSG